MSATVEVGARFGFFGWSVGWLAGDEDCQIHFLPKNPQKSLSTQGHQETCLTLNLLQTSSSGFKSISFFDMNLCMIVTVLW